jgi:NitT/TauT family transport system substrate-binding protein
MRIVSLLTLLAMLAVTVAACGGGSDKESTATSTSAGKTPATAASPAASPAASGELTKVTVGYVPVLVFAPVILAHDKGYFAEYGLDVQLEPLPGGSDMVVLTANGDFDIGVGGAGPAYFNASERGIDLKIIGPLHMERSPQATPLVVSKKRFDSGELTKVSDLKGKKVSVNARGATEYWLYTALQTDGLTIEDIDLQTLGFPDVPAALASGALDGAMLGEPIATQAEKSGTIVRLESDFPENFEPTFAWVNPEFAKASPDLVTGFMAGLMRGCRDLLSDDWDSDENLQILQKATNVPTDLIREASRSYCEANGEIHEQDLATLQTFFGDRGLLEYDTPLDIPSLIDRSYVDAALEMIGKAETR